MGTINFDVDDEPIVLSKHLMDILLSQPKAGNLIALYCFYYYTAKWQKTNQPKATTEYVANGLDWSTDFVRKYKNCLIDLKLIKNVVRKDEEGKIIGHFIKLNFIWSKEKVDRINNEIDSSASTLRKNLRVVYSEPNALSSNNKSPDLFANPIPKNKEEKYLPFALQLSTIIKTTKKLNIPSKTISTWATEIRKLCEIDGADTKRIKKVLSWYEDNVGGDFIPVIESGTSFRKKFMKLEDAIRRSEQPIRNNRPPKIYDGIQYKFDPADGLYKNRAGDTWT